MVNWTLLLKPALFGLIRRPRLSGTHQRLRAALLSVLAATFWLLTLWAFLKVLEYFKGIDPLGELLAAKLLSMILLTFLALLVFSNVVTSLSTHFLSEDISFLMAQPIACTSIHRAKMVHVATRSSWMVMLFGAPVFLAYGIAFRPPASYYLLVLISVTPYICIATFTGCMVVLILANLFPARRARGAMVWMGASFGVLLYLLIRFLNPERWADPQGFSGVLQYLSSVQSPQFPLLPSHWVSETLLPILFARDGHPVFYLALLWSTAAAFAVFTGWMSDVLYSRAWCRAQQGAVPRRGSMDLFWKMTGWVLLLFPKKYRSFMTKDLKSFSRDTRQWSQLFLMGALIVVYLYNFSVLPLDEVNWWGGWYVRHLLGLFNLALAGFVVTAVGARFVFPSVSMEGRAVWVPSSAPLSFRDMVWSKFWGGWLPLVFVALVLVGASNALLGVSAGMMIMSLFTMTACCFGIVGLAVGVGAIHARFEEEDPAKVATSLGGVFYMMVAVGFVLGVVLLEAIPMYILFHSRFRSLTFGWLEWLIIGGIFLMVAGLWYSAIWIPMKKGTRALEKRQAWP